MVALPSRFFARAVLAVALAVMAGLGCAAPALAQDAPTAAFQHEVWVTSGFVSHHDQHRERYEQNNTGIGVEWRYARDWQFNAGRYRNSMRDHSTYLQVGWMPLVLGPTEGLHLRAGGSVGVVNGYSEMNQGGWFPTLLPVVTVQWKRMAVNLLYIPTVGGRVDGAVALQFKLQLY